MLSDLRHSCRALAKSPMFTFVAIFTLMLGIGVNTAMFSIVNAAMLRGLPFPQQERLAHVSNQRVSTGQDNMDLSYLDFADYRAAQKFFEDLAAYQEGTFNISGPGGDPERVQGCTITHSGPAMLRVPPHLGRWFHADEGKPGAPAVVVLGYSVWQNRFKGDPAIVGQQVKVNGEWSTVVGIGPRDYRFPQESDAWRPLRYAKDEPRSERYFEVFGRLKDGVTLAAANAEMQGLARQLAQAHPDVNKGVDATVKTLHEIFIGDETARMLSVMLGAVSLVLLIACANVANLLLARAAVRQKEIAVRTALGSSRARIVRLLLGEALVLSAGGAVLGLGVAFGLTKIFAHYIEQSSPPYWLVFKTDAMSVVYVVVIALVSTLLAGLWPAWRASRGELTTVLKDGGRGSTGFALSKFTRAMVIFEVVLSCVLLVMSGLYVRSVIKMQQAPLGFETAGVFTNRIGLPEVDYQDVARQVDFYQNLLTRFEARPEVSAAALSSVQPTWNNRSTITLEGREPSDENAPRLFAGEAAVSTEYFKTLGITLVSGRAFEERDTATSERVVIVSTKFAEKYWPGENPLGKRFRYGSNAQNKNPWLTVVGIVTPTLYGEFENNGSEVPQAYIPFTQRGETRFMTLFLKARGGDAAALAPVARGTVREMNEDLPVYWPQTLDAMVGQAKFFKQMFAWIFGVFGGVALVLAGVGLYGVMAYSVSQRTQEIGVRMALGASSGDVLRLILREGGVRLAIGLVIGLGLGVFAAKLQGEFLYGIEPFDVPTFAGTFVTLGVAGLAACVIPALRALRVNPVEALRGD